MMTLREYAAGWHSGSGGNFCSAVWERDRRRLLKRILSLHGDVLLSEIEPRHVWDAQRLGVADGVRASSINRATAAIMALVRDAEAEGLVPDGRHELLSRRVHYQRENPEKRFRAFTLEQREEILRLFRVHQPHFYSFVAFLFHTGCRISEAIALTWDDVDLNAQRVRIWRSFTQGLPGNCKTRRSVRPIKLSSELAHTLAVAAISRRTGLLFVSEDGHRIQENNFNKRVWKPTLKLARIPVPMRPPRCSRHTFTSIAFEKGMPASAVSRQTGDRIEMLERAYAEFTEEFQNLDIDRAVGVADRRRAPRAA